MRHCHSRRGYHARAGTADNRIDRAFEKAAHAICHALNKVDRLYGWKVCPNMPIREALAQQDSNVISEFETRSTNLLVEMAEQGLNAKLYYENDDYRRQVSVVPTSAMTGEGVPDILLLVVQLSQDLMTKKLTYHQNFECTLLEVKVVEGLGTTIDVVLVNGVIYDSDQLVVCGMNGPIVTSIRALLTPQPMKEIRVKGAYVHHKQIKAAMGIKIAAPNLDGAVAGTNVFVHRPSEGDDLDHLKSIVMEDMKKGHGQYLHHWKGRLCPGVDAWGARGAS